MLLKWIKLLKYIALCESVGMAGSYFTVKSIPEWYEKLKKPSINPPSWIFGPVWTILYALMGTAAYMVSQKKERGQKISIVVFYLQLILNFLWTVLFFGMHSPFAALIEIFALWFFILITIMLFWTISPKAALLLFPYLLWVSFASVLNYKLWRINY
ncbi:MAG TPA: TspO/MBR family protein [Chitinispirillaceae bacterium]|nr:TspO/MBR family protein [Chitinispirillaceae bacterium]